MKKLLIIITIALFILLPLTAFSAESGKCGDNLTWTLDDEGTLTINGTGDMWNFYSNRDLPWVHFFQMLKIVINAGVTSIGDYAFDDCNMLTSLYIPANFKNQDTNYGTDKIVYYSADTCDNGIKYSFDFSAVPELSGNLYVAAYDSTDKLLSVNIQQSSGTLTFNGTVAYYKAFLWNDNFKPISATGKIMLQ